MFLIILQGSDLTPPVILHLNPFIARVLAQLAQLSLLYLYAFLQEVLENLNVQEKSFCLNSKHIKLHT